jgi:hypothetical protein
LSVGLTLWIVKACEFDFEFKLGAWLTRAYLGPNWLTVGLSRWLLMIVVGLTSRWVISG